MPDVRDDAIYRTTGKRNRAPNLTTHRRIRDILISNVSADGVNTLSGIQIRGLPEQPIAGVRWENIRRMSQGGGTTNDAAITSQELGAGYPGPGKIGTLPADGIFARHVKDWEPANGVSHKRLELFSLYFADLGRVQPGLIRSGVCLQRAF